MKTLTVPQKHQKNIALKTLKMSDVGAVIMGGMTKAEARVCLAGIGYSKQQISKIENEGTISVNNRRL